MPPASRVTDIGLGHGSFIPTPIITGSPNVITGSLPQAAMGDSLLPHPSPSPSPPHPRNIATGSFSISVNSRPMARMGDAVSCGGLLGSGFATVIVG